MAYQRRCPRCEQNIIPCNEHPGEYPGAMSRIEVDGRRIIEVCSQCGEDEAFEMLLKKRYTPVSEWPVDDWLDITKQMHTMTEEHRGLMEEMRNKENQ
jgi:hypothetical protein